MKKVKTQTGEIGNVVEISRGIVVIAEQTAAGTEEAASSSNELAAGMESSTTRAEKVASIANNLVHKVNKFKLTKNIKMEAWDNKLSIAKSI